MVGIGIVDSDISAEGGFVFKRHCKKAVRVSGGQVAVLAGAGIPKLHCPGDNQVLLLVEGLKQIGNPVQRHLLKGSFLGRNSGPAPFIGITGKPLCTVNFYDVGPLSAVKTSYYFQCTVNGIIQAVRSIQDPDVYKRQAYSSAAASCALSFSMPL